MTNQGLLYSGIGLLIASLSLMIVLIRASKKEGIAYSAIRAKGGNAHYEQMLLWLYRHLSKFFLTRLSIQHIRSRIEIVSNNNETSVRLKVIKVYCGIMTLVLILFALVILLTDEGLMTLLWLFMLWVIAETLIDFLVVRLKNRLLWQQIKFNETVRHRYYQSGMVDEAIYESCGDLNKDHYEIGLQGERMIDVLMSADPEQGMIAYNELAPNKYLKIFLSLAYMTMEYGDTSIEGVSVFMKNLHDLTNEVRIELNKRERLNYALRSLNVIVLLPLLMIAPIKNWASAYFMPLQRFYESQTGFVLEIVIVILILSCYILLRKVQQFDQKHQARRGKKAFVDQLYQSKIKGLFKGLMPKATDRKYYRLSRQLKRTRSRISVEGFVLRQWLCAIGIVLFGLMIALSLHGNAKRQVLMAPTIEESFLGGQLSESELEKAKEITNRDNRYLSLIDRKTSYDEILEILVADAFDMTEAELVANQIRQKQLEFYGQYLKLGELFAILLIGVIGFHIPKLLLVFRRRLLLMEIEDEVAGFSTIVLMLMHHERLTITDILEWFELYSTTFSEVIGDCINNMSSGMTEALMELKETSEHDQFTRLIEGLVLAAEDITIKQAFDELDTEKHYHLEQRKENNRRLVEKKINLGNMIGFLPVYGLIVIYMIIPMVIIGMNDMAHYFEQLSL